MAVRAGNDGGGRDERPVGALHAGGAVVFNLHRSHAGFVPHGAAEPRVTVCNGLRKSPRAAGDETGVLPGSERQHHHQHQGRHALVAGDDHQRLAEESVPVAREVGGDRQIFLSENDGQHREVAQAQSHFLKQASSTPAGFPAAARAARSAARRAPVGQSARSLRARCV